LVTGTSGTYESNFLDSHVNNLKAYLERLSEEGYKDPETGTPVTLKFNVTTRDYQEKKTKENGKNKKVDSDMPQYRLLMERLPKHCN